MHNGQKLEDRNMPER